ncbi:hypothetical protein AB4Z51_03325 [Bradyrhizobium sp. 2TAF36]|uniref:hypothetical protein n=1 Tax=Bradyrhizobium sp. 2TAF36 TaxID=3233016 RepID=UPI003F90A6A6
MPNRHPVDQLADIRAEIKQLKAREDQLRAEVLDHPEDLAGDEHEAMLVQMRTERLDVEKLKRELGLAFLRPFLREQVVTRVQFKPTKKTRRKTAP